MNYDFFISHASADKEEVARPLAELLKKKGLKVWFDDDCIAHGQDVILEKLEEGLQSSEFFIIIFSHSYFKDANKPHRRLERASIFEKNNKVLIRHGISVDEFKKYPQGQLYGAYNLNLSTDKGLEVIVQEIETKFNTKEKLGTTNTAQVKKMPKTTDGSNNQEDVYAIGIDVGNAYIDSGVVQFPSDDSQPPQIYKRIERTQWKGKDESRLLVEKICNAIVDISVKCFIHPSKISYIGVGLPGQVDPTEGILLNAPGLSLEGLQIADLISEKLTQVSSDWEHNIKVFIDNDVTCSAVAEKIKGEGSGGRVKNFVCVAIGKGLGAGIVADDRLYRGYNHNAGEVGHMVIDIRNDARSCPCGSKGCFESYCSERGIIETSIQHISEARKNNPSSDLAQLSNDKDNLKPEDISAIIAASTDPLVAALREELARHFAVGLSNVANMFNPKVIVITGGIGVGFFSQEVFQNDVVKLMKLYTLESNQVRIGQNSPIKNQERSPNNRGSYVGS